MFRDITGVGLNRDFFAEVSLGKVDGWSRMIFKGFLPTATPPAYIWTGGTFTWRTTTTTVEILSSSVNDAAAGTGARTVTVQGVGVNYAATSETVTLNGTNVVALANAYIHINKLIVATAGSGQTNAGGITARITGAGATVAHIAAGATVSQSCMIMTAANQVYLSLNQVIGTSSATNLNVHTFVQEQFSSTGILTRDNVFHISTNGTTPFVLPQDIPLIIPEKTGLAWRLTAIGSGTPDVTARIQGMFVDLTKGY